MLCAGVLLVASSGVAASPASLCAAAGWKQVWGDDFGGSAVDPAKWDVRATNKGTGGGNVDRLAKVMPDDIYVEDGALVLRTQRRQAGIYNYTSGAWPILTARL